MNQNGKVQAIELLNILDQYNDIKYLSLDCFDTLLFRKVTTPEEVFNNLNKYSTFSKMKFDGAMRIFAEIRARNFSNLNNGHYEVVLEDVYRYGFNLSGQKVIDKLVEEEIACDLELLYGFLPSVELIKRAADKGLKVIIVSDTYYSSKQLRAILCSILSPDLVNLITHIYCSSEYGKSKSRGLFGDILNKLKCLPEEILHIGDNHVADYLVPTAFKIHCLHLCKHDDYMQELNRLQDLVGKVVNTTLSHSVASYNPYQAVFAIHTFAAERPHELIGYASLGPIMYAFANYIKTEFHALKNNNKNPKLLFIMRDGYLPLQAYNEISRESDAEAVHISRFAAYACSFSTRETIIEYLLDNAQTNRYVDLARQLLLSDEIANQISTTALNSINPSHTFYQLIMQKKILNYILKASHQYRNRLLKHINTTLKLDPGATCVFVDVGYSGTVQRKLTPFLNDMGVEVTGRYLISLDFPGHDKVQKGLFDSSWCDSRALKALVYYISWFEQLCTCNVGSSLDYDHAGEPILSIPKMNPSQNEKLLLVQRECLRFIRDLEHFATLSNFTIDNELQKQFALSALSRLIFLPTSVELDYLASFEAEMNLGTDGVMQLFDVNKGMAGLRRKSLFYMEKPSERTRTNYPAELRAAGMEWALTHLLEHRFCLRINANDMTTRKQLIPIIFKQGVETYSTTTHAYPTYDGYMAIMMPANMQVAMIMGEVYNWLQIECIDLIPLEHFAQPDESQYIMDGSSYVSFQQMKHCGDNLYQLDHTATIEISPVNDKAKNGVVMRLVFRPLSLRHSTKPTASITTEASRFTPA